ncbi:ornithine carbamoyltransferase [Nocardioides sp. InS609-2]|uniref:ornithine carbamoyltransferase n=1 Tax=Nocardioides sp. InS609-2 TaxID=2760705 RepID=UPI0020C132A7|nr:ornithine carbamoyltransferase [Nocardioides sp. InS609-2]
MTRHFLRDDDLSPAEQAEVLALAADLKRSPYDTKSLAGPRTVAMIFDKQTLRTQASFSAGIAELGGHPMLVDGSLAGIGVRESIPDVARVLGRQASVIVWRTGGQERIDAMAEHSGVPIVNALTDEFHPCQLLADLQTVQEQLGRLAEVTVTFLGDGSCNMAHSWLLAGATAGMHVRVSAPDGFQPSPDVVDAATTIAATTGGSVVLEADPAMASTGADVLVTDTWVSMGREADTDHRLDVLASYSLTQALLDLAAPDAIAMHCLPAYRGKEIAAEVIDGPCSVVWDEAENRRHAQKAILTWLLQREGAS